MTLPDLLDTKFFIPSLRADLISRPRLVERLNNGVQSKLTLISAPAGFGKTTLASEWVDQLQNGRRGNQDHAQVAWLSLDEGENDPARFLTYFIEALNQVEGLVPPLGNEALALLHSPQPPPAETLLTSLLNQITVIPDQIIFILDDYHLVESVDIDEALIFLLEHLPPQLHLVIMTRVDPQLPLTRMRARNQLTELRGSDLRFTSAEAADFLNHTMGLNLSEVEIHALETRTEGWIAGLQLAAISMQGQEDPTEFIRSFSSSHQFVLDYLIEEVLEQRPAGTKDFLLKTSILDRFNSSLCDSVMGREGSQEIIEMLNAANLFIVPLDNERNWYRYHHLFSELLRQRFHQINATAKDDFRNNLAELHIRASEWFETNDEMIMAFRHATAANDVDRAVRLIEGGGMPLTFRGALEPVLKWLESLPNVVLDDKPSLWVGFASAVLATGQVAGVEEKLLAAEAALQGAELDETSRDILGRIAATRATLAWGQDNAEAIVEQSRRALEYLHPDNLPFRTSTHWKLASAYQLMGDRASALQAYSETIAECQASGNFFINILASSGMGDLQISENQLYQAAETYQRILQLVGDRPPAAACGAFLGLAKISYEWNELESAQQYGGLGIQLARQIVSTDAFAQCAVFLARLELSQGQTANAATNIREAEQFVLQHDFMRRMPDVVSMKVQLLLYEGNIYAAAELAEKHKLPLSQARVLLAKGDPSAALAVIAPLQRQAEEKDWKDARLRVSILQALALQASGEKDKPVGLLADALELAEPGGFIRIFVEEGQPMARILQESLNRGICPAFIKRLLAAFPADDLADGTSLTDQSGLVEPLSERELEVLQHIAEGLTNREIAARLYLSLNTVKVHTRNIYSKLGVSNRTRAVVRAREIGIQPAS